MPRNQLPKLSEVAPVFGVICFMIYAWTLLGTFRLVAVSWHLFMSMGDMLSLVAYQLTTAFIECVLVQSAILLLAAVLPFSALRAQFPLRGTILAFSFLGSLMGYYQLFLLQELLSRFGYWLAGFLALVTLLLVASAKWLAVERAILAVADRCVVFLYIILPGAGVAMAVVFFRNI